MQKQRHVAFGVAAPRPWSAQLEECEAQCRRDVTAVAASCRAVGQSFTDQDFPPDARSLYVNGQDPSSSLRMPTEVEWCRASQLSGHGGNKTFGTWPLDVVEDSRLTPGAIDDTAFLGAVALLRAAQRPPDELIVQHDLNVGVVGVRLFKDGEWVYEVIDDHLPCRGGCLACGATTTAGEAWIALLEKANAKIHGTYEAVQRTTELEALEDLTGAPVRRLERRDMASDNQEFAQLLGERQQHGCSLHLAVRRRERRGEEHSSGILSGHGYPISEAERFFGGVSCRLENPWSRGCRGSGEGRGHERESFMLSADELARNFTDVLEVQVVPPAWPVYRVTVSTDRPSYPLLSSRMVTQCVLTACQRDRRWSRQDSYLNGLGLRVYRCRVQALPSGQAGVRQDPKANPFESIELVRRRPLGKTRSVCVEFTLEPYALYMVAVDSQYRCPLCVLRFACSADVQFRELSAQEAGHFLSAAASALPAADADGADGASEASGTTVGWRTEDQCEGRDIALRCLGGSPELSEEGRSNDGSLLSALLARFSC